ncbi:hypothetical protein KKE45_00050 [Patescibacteria group bacterium]|nr:hypothetical protein [Patescibacteria group bacterium]
MGNDAQVDWLLKNFSNNEMVDVLKKSKKLSAKSANYWSFYFKVPKKKVMCLKKEYQSRQNRFC